MRKTFSLVLGALLALTLSGCEASQTGSPSVPASDSSSSQSSMQSIDKTSSGKTTVNEVPSFAAAGDAVELSTSNGTVTVTVVGVYLDQKATAEDLEHYGNLPEGYSIYELCLLVRNDSFCDEWNEDMVDLAGLVDLVDGDGITVEPENSGSFYMEYSPAPGAYCELKMGQTRKFAIPYYLKTDSKSLTVIVGDTTVPVEVNSEPSSIDYSKSASQPGENAKTANAGDEIKVETAYGDVTVAVQKVAIDYDALTWGADNIPDGYSYGLVCLLVRNDSYSDQYDDYVSLSADVSPVDENGVCGFPESSGGDYQEYSAAPGAYFELKQGQSKRVAIPCKIKTGTATATVLVGSTYVTLPISE